MDPTTMLFKGDENKVFKLNLDTYLYTRQIQDYQKYTNVIDLNLTQSLLELVNTVQSFLSGAQVKETSKTSLSVGIKNNFDSKVLLLRKMYVCSLCNIQISGRENMLKHFCDQQHLKNVKIKENILQQSTQSNKASIISSGKNEPKPLTPAQIQRNLRRAEKLEKQRWLALNPFGEELPKITAQMLSKPIQQLEQLTMRLIDDGKAQAKNIVTYQSVCSHIEMALRVFYPSIKSYVFGSRITGLSTAKGDIDIYVDIGEFIVN